ncbi:hypothetical protein Tco_1376040 [Tanacetum coccineum]
MNTRLNIKNLDENNVQKHGGSKQVGSKKLGFGVKTGVHRVHVQNVRFEVELQGAKGNRKAEGFQASNDDAAVAQRKIEDRKHEERQTQTAWYNAWLTRWSLVRTLDGDIEYRYRPRITIKIGIRALAIEN